MFGSQDSAQRVVEDGNKVAHFLENDALAIAARVSVCNCR